MLRKGMPETVPKNCGMAVGIGLFSGSIVTFSASSHHFSPYLLKLLVFSLGSCDASLNGKAI